MKTQIIKDDNGRPTGAFIPIEQWEHLKSIYPDIEKADDDLPQWQMDLLDERLEQIKNDPSCLRPIEELYALLDKRADEL